MYIELEKAIGAVEGAFKFEVETPMNYRDIAVETLKLLTTDDVEEVVRCKDCKYYLGLNERCELTLTRLRFYNEDKVWDEECYCCWGERKDETEELLKMPPADGSTIPKELWKTDEVE